MRLLTCVCAIVLLSSAAVYGDAAERPTRRTSHERIDPERLRLLCELHRIGCDDRGDIGAVPLLEFTIRFFLHSVTRSRAAVDGEMMPRPSLRARTGEPARRFPLTPRVARSRAGFLPAPHGRGRRWC